MKGRSRLGIKNELTETLLEIPDIAFLEARSRETDFGTWEEYYALFSLRKIEDPEFLSYITFRMKSIFNIIVKFGVDNSGIQEFECSDCNYNLLIYIIKNGKEKECCREFEYYNELFGKIAY